MSKFIICFTVTGCPAITIICHTNKINFLMGSLHKKYNGLKNPNGVNMLYSCHLLVGLIGQLLCPKCNNGPLVLHKQPIGIGVVGFHSVHTRYVIIVSLYIVSLYIVSLYIVFNLLTKIIAIFFLFFLLSELCTRMRTTNPNESFNIQAWRRTPKDLLVTKLFQLQF